MNRSRYVYINVQVIISITQVFIDNNFGTLARDSACIIFRVVLYGCETWSFTFRKERRLRMFEKRVLRKILGSKRNEVRGEWRKLHNEELNDLYCSPNIFG